MSCGFWNSTPFTGGLLVVNMDVMWILEGGILKFEPMEIFERSKLSKRLLTSFLFVALEKFLQRRICFREVV